MAFTIGNTPIPLSDPIARARRRSLFGPKEDDPLEGTLTDAWVDWFSRLSETVANAATRVFSASLTAQAASIAATDISNGALQRGVYRVSYYARITTPASIGSSLDTTISWTDGTVAQSITGGSLTGNTVTTLETFTYLIHIDGGTPVRYSTVYTSVGTPMQYRLDVSLELVQQGVE